LDRGWFTITGIGYGFKNLLAETKVSKAHMLVSGLNM